MATPKVHPKRRRGISLLEVILAIAILGGSLAVLGELIRIGTLGAASARDLSTAQILCETKLAEISAGIVTPDPVDSAQADETGEWLYSVASEQIDQQGLLAVTVTVQQNPDIFARPVSFALVRWIVDPAAIPVESTETEPTSGSTSTSGTSTSGTTTSGTTGGGASAGGASGT